MSHELKTSSPLKDAIWRNKMHYYNYLAKGTDAIVKITDDECMHSCVTRTPWEMDANEDTPLYRNGNIFAFYNHCFIPPHRACQDSKEDQLQLLLNRVQLLDKELQKSRLNCTACIIPDQSTERKIQLLKANRYIQMDDTPGMAAHLPTSEHIDKHTLPSNFKIYEINGEDETFAKTDDLIRKWTNILVKSHGMPDRYNETSDYFFNVFKNVTMGPKLPMRSFVGVIGEKAIENIVSVATLFYDHEGYAGLYNISTLRSQTTGRCYGKPMALSLMKIAREDQYEYMVVQATKDGYPTYQRIGYSDHISIPILVNVHHINSNMKLPSWILTNPLLRNFINISTMVKFVKNKKTTLLLLIFLIVMIIYTLILG